MGCCGERNKKKFIINDNERDSCKKTFLEIPSKTDLDLQTLKEVFKELTKTNSPEQKAHLIFYWICHNIEYDSESKDNSPEGVVINRKTKCSGFAHLYQDISSFLGLEVECKKCYSKGYGYEPGMQLTQVNHEYNFIKLDGEWYPIDATWGTGYFEGKNFVKNYNDFYFLTDPEILIKTHFPENKEWQLTNRTYSLKQFLKWPIINYNFYKYGFKIFSEEGYIKLNRNQYKFLVYGDKMENIIGNCSIFLIEGSNYNQKTNLYKINYYRDRFEIDCIFNQKGKYKIDIFSNDDGSDTTYVILKYIVNVNEDAKKELYYPLYFKDSKNINIIEPLYNNLKSGETVKFKIKSTLEKLIIIDDKKQHNFEKKKNGIFEKEIQIKTTPGDQLFICNKIKESYYNDLVSYNII